MTLLHVFDMDGTLLHGTSAAVEVARACGTETELRDLERAFGSGEIGTKAFAATLHAMWSDLTEEHVDLAFSGAPFLDGIAEVCADIRERGERSIVVTMSPDFFARRLLGFGFDDVAASRFPPLPFTRPLDPDAILVPRDKVRIVEKSREAAGIPLQRCVAYGDSRSDAPLFGHVAHSVAVNADRHLAGIARAEYSGTSLLEAYTRARESVAAA